MGKDPEYVLNYKNEALFEGQDFNLRKKQYKALGVSLLLNTSKALSVPVYTPQLAMVLSSSKIKAFNRIEQTDEIFNGTDFCDSYGQGFVDGTKYFEKEWKVNLSALYGEYSEQYIRELHRQYFHAGKNDFEGWNYVKRSYPLVICHDVIQEFGYHTGLVYKLEGLKKQHGRIFDKHYFDKCNQDSVEFSQAESEPKPSLEEAENKFCSGMEMKIPYWFFNRLTTQRSRRDNKPFLSEEQFNEFIVRAFLKEQSAQKQTLNVGNREKGFIVKLFYDFYYKEALYYDAEHYTRETYIKLLTDNFTNWTYDQIKNNFKNTVKREWASVNLT